MHTDWKKIYIGITLSLVVFLAFFAYLWIQIIKVSVPDKTTVHASPAIGKVPVDAEPRTNASSTRASTTPVLDDIAGSEGETATSGGETRAEFWEKLNQAETASSSYIRFVDHDVPFTSQAPYAEWDDPRQQDACEEVSVLMAVKYLFGEDLDPKSAKEEILRIAEFEEDNYGTYVDTSAEDTGKRILSAYFNVDDYNIKDVKNVDDLIGYIMDDYLLIAPMNGQALENPNFSLPGPEKHMVLIRGYDPDTGEFITNDPGTRKGEAYRYNEDVIFFALRDYPTGDHAPIWDKNKRVILLKLNKKASREVPLFYAPEND